ncbi:hypothetical protein ACFSTH_04370 [Paenibacillus yanchengensis]|uniref:Uncharacterized protein n=1 Tax=Paenibacillus yanchengensis TaxID=2035833 RepID=A0ABW4YJQ9_9BACL
MRRLQWFVSAMLITIIGTMLLVILSPAIKKNSSPIGAVHKEVFSYDTIQHLNNYNIVDWIVGLSLQQKLGRVEWSNQLLIIELHVDIIHLQPDEWLKDVQQLVEASFKQVTNVERILIRLLEPKELNRQLLATVDVRKSDSWINEPETMEQLKYRNPLYDPIWRERLRINVTSLWKEKFGVPRI